MLQIIDSERRASYREEAFICPAYNTIYGRSLYIITYGIHGGYGRTYDLFFFFNIYFIHYVDSIEK